MPILDCLVSNVIVASCLALVATIANRFANASRFRHVLWLLVLVKLVTPPLFLIPLPHSTPLVGDSHSWHNTPRMEPTQEGNLVAQTISTAPSAAVASTSIGTPHDASGTSIAVLPAFPTTTGSLFIIWLAGAAIWYSLAISRLFRFHRLLGRLTCSEGRQLDSQIRRIASRLGLTKDPAIRIVDANIPPLVWSFGGTASIVLPKELLSQLSSEQCTCVLAHELAHLRRRDHWTRWFEIVVLGIYWWNPLVWWARAQLQRAEEECCDGLVLATFPNRLTDYAQTLLDTIDYLATRSTLATGMTTALNQGNALRQRIELILSSDHKKDSARTQMTILAAIATLTIPLSLVAADSSLENNEERNSTAKREAPHIEKTINGVVLDANSNPISDANVSYSYAFSTQAGGTLTVETVSTEDGSFMLRVPKLQIGEKEMIGNNIWAYKNGFSLSGAALNKETPPRIVLRAPTDTSIVVLAPDGTPAKNALVEVVHYRMVRNYDLVPSPIQPSIGGRTDEAGKLSLPALERDRLLRLKITSDYGVQTQQFRVHADEPAERTIQLRHIAQLRGKIVAENIEWAVGKKLHATTSDMTRGGVRPPWPTQGEAEVAVQADGSFFIPAIATGRIERLHLNIAEEAPVRPRFPDFVKLVPGLNVPVDIPLENLVEIQGTVVAEDSKEPLRDIDLHIYYGVGRQGTDVTTDVDGHYTARVLPGNVRMQAMSLSKTRFLQLGSPKNVNVPAVNGFEIPNIEFVSTRKQAGRLVDEENQPVVNKEVFAYYDNWLCSTAKTDEEGYFELPKLPKSMSVEEGLYRVTMGIGEMRSSRTGDVTVRKTEPFILKVRR